MSPPSRPNLLASPRGRKLLFGSLYFSEGAPIGFLWLYLPKRLASEGMAVGPVSTLLATLALFWSFKFVWGPLVDGWRSPRWTLKSWVLSMQLLMGLALVPLVWLDPVADFRLLFILLCLHALAAAIQDASIDALSIASTPLDERGAVNGWMQVGMLLGRSLFGGVALMLAAHLGGHIVACALIGAIWCTSLLLLLAADARHLAPMDTAHQSRWADHMHALNAAFRRRTTWLGLGFALIGGMAYEAVGGVRGHYLTDRGFSDEQVGLFFAVYVTGSWLLGSLAGGYLADRMGRRRSVAVFLLCCIGVVLLLAGADTFLDLRESRICLALLSVLYFCIGMFIASSYALFMDLTDDRLGATQFSAFMGATNGCEAIALSCVGRLIPQVGFAGAFTIMAVASLIALPLLYWMPSTNRAVIRA